MTSPLITPCRSPSGCCSSIFCRAWRAESHRTHHQRDASPASPRARPLRVLPACCPGVEGPPDTDGTAAMSAAAWGAAAAVLLAVHGGAVISDLGAHCSTSTTAPQQQAPPPAAASACSADPRVMDSEAAATSSHRAGTDSTPPTAAGLPDPAGSPASAARLLGKMTMILSDPSTALGRYVAQPKPPDDEVSRIAINCNSHAPFVASYTNERYAFGRLSDRLSNMQQMMYY